MSPPVPRAIAVPRADVPWMERGIATVVPGVYPAARGERARAAPLLVCYSGPVVLGFSRSVAMPRSPAGGVGCRAARHLPAGGVAIRHAANAMDGAWAPRPLPPRLPILVGATDPAEDARVALPRSPAFGVAVASCGPRHLPGASLC